MTDPAQAPTNFSKETRNNFLLIIGILTVLNLIPFFVIFMKLEDESGTGYLLYFLSMSVLFWFVIVPTAGFVLGSLLAFLPYKKNTYRKKYLRASLISWMIFTILIPLFLFLTLYVFDPLPTKECDCVDKTKQDSVAAVLENNLVVTVGHFYALADEKGIAAIPSIDSVLKMTEEQMQEKNIFSGYESKIELHYLKGKLYYDAADYTHSLKEFRASDDDDFLKARAACYIQLKQYAEAEALLRAEFKNDPDLNYLLGNLFEVSGNIDSAKAAYGGTTNDAAIMRLNELNKKHPELLTDFAIPSHRPE